MTPTPSYGKTHDMLIAQISDPHVTTEGTAIRALVDTPQRLVDALDTCAGLPRVPDVILLTGDLVNDGTPAEYELLAAALASAPCPVLPIPGNHDDAARLRATFATLDCCPVELPDPTGPFHYVVDDHPVRLVAFDTTDAGNHSGLVTTEGAQWLDRTLALRPEAPTIVFMHHVPYATGAWWFDYNGVAGAEFLREVLANHTQVVRVVAGHVHRTSSTQWGRLTLSAAPSTAYLSGTGVAGGPPVIIDQRSAVQLFSWDGDAILASEADLPASGATLDLRHMNPNWDAYEQAAKAQGPISKERFGG